MVDVHPQRDAIRGLLYAAKHSPVVHSEEIYAVPPRVIVDGKAFLCLGVDEEIEPGKKVALFFPEELVQHSAHALCLIEFPDEKTNRRVATLIDPNTQQRSFTTPFKSY